MTTAVDTGSLDEVGVDIKDSSDGGRIVWPEVSTAQTPSMTMISSLLLKYSTLRSGILIC